MDSNPQSSSEEPKDKQPQLPGWAKFFPWILLIIFFVVAWFLPSILGQNGGSQNAETVSYTTFIEQVNANNVQSVTINGYTVTGVFKSPVPSADGTTKSTNSRPQCQYLVIAT